MLARLSSFFAALCVLAFSCQAAPVGAPLRISSFSTVLTEIGREVGGDQVEVLGHIHGGEDPHEYEPKARDLEAVGKADLILLSARQTEAYVEKLRTSSGGRAPMVEVGKDFSPADVQGVLERITGNGDPHWWHSIACMKKATRIVRDALAQARPGAKDVFEANAARYIAGLDQLLKWARVQVAQVPRDRRVLVTSHDAFRYLAAELGFDIYAVEGLSSAEQPSAKTVAGIITEIKARKVRAIFAETIENPKVLKEITRETGAVIGGELVADGLGEGPLSTYAGMYKHNIQTIVGALR